MDKVEQPEANKPVEKKLRTKAEMASHGVKLKADKKPKTKYIIGGALLFIVGAYFLFKPYPASQLYGICKTYIELSVPYPHTLQYADLSDRGMSIRFQYAYIDPYGQKITFPIQCNFAVNEQTQKVHLADVKVNRDRPHPLEDENLIKAFNKNLDVDLFSLYQPDLTWPNYISHDIRQYKR